MKNSRAFIPVTIVIILIGLIVTLAIFKSLFNTGINNISNTPGVLNDDTALSSSETYFQGVITTASGAPQRTVTNPGDNTGLSIYWIKGSVSGGNDTCTLYDTTTNRIYASRYKTNGQFSGRSMGSMYYINDEIKQKKALSLLDSTCFKD